MLLYISRDDVFFFSPADPWSVLDLLKPKPVAQINIQILEPTFINLFKKYNHVTLP